MLALKNWVNLMWRPNLVAIALLVLSQTALSNEGDTFRPYISQSVAHDDNLFRLDKNISLPTGLVRSDTISSTAAGLDVNWQRGKQALSFNVELSDNRFSNNDYLNYQGSKGNGLWKWELGERWEGDLSASTNTRQINFTDFQVTSGVNKANQLTEDRVNLIARYKLLSDWKLGAGLSMGETRFSNPLSQALNRQENEHSIEVTHTGHSSNFWGVRLSQNRTQFNNRPYQVGNLQDDGYLLNSAFLNMNYEVGNKTALFTRIGYQALTNNNLTNRNIDTVSARAVLTWRQTAKMKLSGSVWQEVNPIDTVVATYVRSQALKLEQSLQATSKTAFLVSLQFENRELDGDPGNLNSPILQTKDYLETWSFAWQYAYNDNLSLSTGYNYAKRDSKTALRDFNSNLLFINAKFQW